MMAYRVGIEWIEKGLSEIALDRIKSAYMFRFCYI